MGAPSEYDFQNLGVHLHDPFPHVFFLLKKKKEGAVTVRSILAKTIILPRVIPAQKKRKEKKSPGYLSIQLIYPGWVARSDQEISRLKKGQCWYHQAAEQGGSWRVRVQIMQPAVWSGQKGKREEGKQQPLSSSPTCRIM